MKKAHLLSLLLVMLAVGVSAATAGTDSSLRVSGTISGVAPGAVTITAADGQTMTFRLVATTTYAKDGQPADTSALAVGETVKVKYHLEANGSLKAKEVAVETVSGTASAPIVVRGSVISVSADTLVIKNDAGGPDLSMRLTATTSYEKDGRPAVVGDLQAGQSVKVKYRVEPDRSLKAQKVKIVLKKSVSFQLEGTLAGADAASLRVRVTGLRENGALVRATGSRVVTVTLSPLASVVRNGRKSRVGALIVGDRVHVTGTVAGGVFSAVRVVAQRAGKKR